MSSFRVVGAEKLRLQRDCKTVTESRQSYMFACLFVFSQIKV